MESAQSPASFIAYEADPLPGGRAQMVRTVVVDGETVPELSGPIGSPAPIATVREHEYLVKL
jgi:hypothetical protein